MNRISRYDIAFKGLKEGVHKFEYQIDEKFFELFEESLVQMGNITADVVIKKQSTLLSLVFNLKGSVELTCDRCLEKYNQPIKQNAEIFVKFGEEQVDDGGDVLWLLPEEHQLNIAQLLYEYIVLSIPVKHVHPDDKYGQSTCNPEMLEQIKKYSGNVDLIDQRWDSLKGLINNN